jgi:hypothetical protein
MAPRHFRSVGLAGAVLLVVVRGEAGETFGGFVEHDLRKGEDGVLREL